MVAMTQKSVGAAVRRIRQSRQLTLEDVVAKSGHVIDTGALSRIERGHLGWTLPTINGISKGLGVPLAVLFAEAARGDKDGDGSARIELVSVVPLVKLGELRGGKVQSAINRTEARVKTASKVGPRAFAFCDPGAAMAPEFTEDDCIVIDPDVTPGFGQYVLVQVEEDEIVFRHLEVEGGKSFLCPVDRRFPVIALKRTHKIIGVALQVIREL